MNHDYMTGKEAKSEWEVRNIAEGGLALCKTCGLLEGALTTDCSGESVDMETMDRIYKGELDFDSRQGWVRLPSKHSPVYWTQKKEGKQQ